MLWPAWLTVGVLMTTLLVMTLELLAPEVAMLTAVTLLMVVGVLPPEEALRSFGSIAVLTVGALLVVAAGVRRTGLLHTIADRLFGQGHTREPLLRMMLPAGFLSAFLNNTPIVAMFTPAVLDWCKRNNLAPSRVLMPLSFGTILGGMCTLIGTSSSLVVDGLMREQGMAGLSMFELSPVGVPVAICGVGIVFFLARHVLPDRRDPMTELGTGSREYLVEMIVADHSPLVNRTIESAGLRHLPGLFLMNIERDGHFMGPVAPEQFLLAGDRLVFTGVASTVVDLQRFKGLSPAPEAHYDPTAGERQHRLFEVVLSARSPLVGSTIREAGFRSRYDAAVLAAHRAGSRVTEKLGDIVLHQGDTLMIEAPKDFDRLWENSADFALVSRMRAEPPPQSRKAPVAIAILLALVVLATFGVLPMVIAAFAAAGAMIFAGILTPTQATRSTNLPVLLTIAAAIGLGRALDRSGAADAVATEILGLGSSFGPLGILAAVYLCASLLATLVGNVAAVAIVFPVAVAAASQAGLDPRPFMIAIAIAAPASFITPTGYVSNLIVYGPGGYKFSDFSRLGLPLQVMVLVMALAIIPVIWPLVPLD